MRIEQYKPVGPLGETLRFWEAPDHAAAKICRRAGGVTEVTTKGGPFINQVEKAIENSSASHGGRPNWSEVEQDIGKRVNQVYRGLKRPGA